MAAEFSSPSTGSLLMVIDDYPTYLCNLQNISVRGGANDDTVVIAGDTLFKEIYLADIDSIAGTPFSGTLAEAVTGIATLIMNV